MKGKRSKAERGKVAKETCRERRGKEKREERSVGVKGTRYGDRKSREKAL